ncbi:TerB family tellurite resistance protein [Reinekea blandensis]|uniref:Co-chaperone DjlA N-terminal domain-containing protein n=1 Tax=Reinekea blandensis MED297 TaxID=314283 RepID=A4BC16_9GAMM|nr:TerB family tellurite resistance protein [Reinekea blandensis]EAR10501.1 hypothetical protein MED297_01730 [Reinekea sp. MED297] [Reinekea blandensis MED297]
MIEQILAFFKGESETDDKPALSAEDAAAVLLIEVMMADHDLDHREKDCIQDILARRMSVSKSDAEICVEVAMDRQQETHDLFEFTRVINDTFDEDQRYELIVDLWRVAFADGQLDKFEDHRIRRVCDMLHLHHSHFIRAKSAAQH